jgi:hypothetical protein
MMMRIAGSDDTMRGSSPRLVGISLAVRAKQTAEVFRPLEALISKAGLDLGVNRIVGKLKTIRTVPVVAVQAKEAAMARD